MPRFVQIAATPETDHGIEQIIALDSLGQIFYYTFESDRWVKLPDHPEAVQGPSTSD
jgi:hypothetical protein